MWAAASLGMAEVRRHLPLMISLGMGVALSLCAYLFLHGYRTGMDREYTQALQRELLVVQEHSTLGEFIGSRLPADLEGQLLRRGVRWAVPEIHTLTGVSMQDVTLLRGVDLDRYRRAIDFDLVAGRSLETTDGARTAMLGRRLAEARDVRPGETTLLRGREFQIVGVFSTGTYVDNEAWVPLKGAQELLGWSEDEVSIFVIPDGEVLSAGDAPFPGVEVVERGRTAAEEAEGWEAMMGLIWIVAQAIGMAAAAMLGIALWRLAWQRRYELAVLRAIGFGALEIQGYLLAQALTVVLSGFSLALGGYLIFTLYIYVDAVGFSVSPTLSAEVLLGSVMWGTVILVAALVVPTWSILRMNLTKLLRAE